MPTQNEIDALQALVERAESPQLIKEDSRPFILIPNGHNVAVIEHVLRSPSRKTGIPVFIRADAFCEYVNEQKTAPSRLYVVNPTNIVAVLNHHHQVNDDKSEAGWGDHRANLTLNQTPEWTTWKSTNCKEMGQREFAQFIDDNSEDIATPTGAELLELIRTIKASQQLEVTGEVDEKNEIGAVGFVVAARTKAGAKEGVELPGEFKLSIAPYEGGEKIPIRARLRIEIRAPKFTLRYELVKVQRIEREALEGIVKTVAEEVKMSPWFGTP